MRASRWLLINAVALALVGAANISAQQFPATNARTLSGKDMNLPIAGSPMLLIAGFSKASSEAEAAWWTRVQPLCRTNPKLICLRAAVLEDAPRLIRPMILSGMRRGTDTAGQDAFLTVFEHEREWKQWFGFSNDQGAGDYAYVGLVNASGTVLWRGSGGRDAGGFEALSTVAVQSLAR